MPVPDFWLVRRTCSGDKAAFGTLYDRHRHGPRVYNLLRRLSGNTTAAEDLTQETFLAAYKSLSAWRGAGAFSSWLCGIAVRRYRSTNKRAIDEAELEESATADDTSDPLTRFLALETKHDLEQAIQELPLPCREAFVLVYVEDFSYKAAAKLLEIPVGTVQSRLNRAKRLLQIPLAHLVAETPTPKGTVTHVPEA